jgi:hypothetical protein
LADAWGGSWGNPSVWGDSWGSSAAATGVPHGVIVRRGKTPIWPTWEQLRAEARARAEEEARVAAQIEALRAERQRMASELRALRASSEQQALQTERLRVGLELERVRARLGEEQRKRVRLRRALVKFKQQGRDMLLREEQDVMAIANLIGELYG